MSEPDRSEDVDRSANDSDNSPEQPSRSLGRFSVFVLAQAAILVVALGAVSQRMRQIDLRSKLPDVRSEPLTIGPTNDIPQIVSDEQLQQVLYKLRPRLGGSAPKINHVDHALRFWGVEAQFNDPDCLSGEEMRTLLTDHREFEKAWGDERPLLRFTENGVRVRTREGRATASHVDHTVAGLAEVGTPAEFMILTPTRRATMRDLVQYAMSEFQLNQTEYEWSALIFALYLPSREFVTNEGQRVSFDMLADRIMRQNYRAGVCYGNHRLHTLAMMLRVDDQHDILSDERREQILEHLREATRRLLATQSEEGYWDRFWPGDEGLDESASDPANNALSARILATGHALEWLSFAPAEVHPPRERLIRAGQWLARTIIELDDETVTEYYTFLTHAGRALALWRGKFPADYLPLALDVPQLKPTKASESTEGDLPAPNPGPAGESKSTTAVETKRDTP